MCQDSCIDFFCSSGGLPFFSGADDTPTLAGKRGLGFRVGGEGRGGFFLGLRGTAVGNIGPAVGGGHGRAARRRSHGVGSGRRAGIGSGRKQAVTLGKRRGEGGLPAPLTPSGQPARPGGRVAAQEAEERTRKSSGGGGWTGKWRRKSRFFFLLHESQSNPMVHNLQDLGKFILSKDT